MPVLPLFQVCELVGEPVNKDLSELARYVANTRRQKKLTLVELTKRGGPSVGWTSMLESGQMLDMPKVATLKRLAQGLGVPLSDLLRVVGYQAQEVESTSDRNHGNHGRSMVLRVVATNDSGQNHGDEPIIGVSSVAAEGIGGPGSQLKPLGVATVLPVIGSAACGEPIEAIMDRAIDTLVLDARYTNGANAAVIVRGDSMSGANIFDGDHVLVRLGGDVRPANGKNVVIRTPDGLACKRYREDELGVYLEEHIAGQDVRRLRYDEAELVGVVVGLHRSM